MKGYVFRLQKLLDIRIDIEEQCKREFKDAQNEKNASEEKLSRLKEDYTKYSMPAQKETIIEIKIRQIYLNTLKESIEKQIEEVKQKDKLLEEKRIELLQKQVDRKTVETLKEKNEKLFIKEQNLIEQKDNDEFALYGFIRRKEA
ncbi:MAG: flagellar export protein FliJ [Bacillota bacterium]|nr:flagellar export protein FliJ [Bacillota bacterium]